MKFLAKSSFVLVLLGLSGCDHQKHYAVECVRVDNDAPVDLAGLARVTATTNKLEFRDLGESLTVRQRESGWQRFVALNGDISIEFLRTEHGSTDICGRAETPRGEGAQVPTIIARIKQELAGRGIAFETPATRPPSKD